MTIGVRVRQVRLVYNSNPQPYCRTPGKQTKNPSGMLLREKNARQRKPSIPAMCLPRFLCSSRSRTGSSPPFRGGPANPPPKTSSYTGPDPLPGRGTILRDIPRLASRRNIRHSGLHPQRRRRRCGRRKRRYEKPRGKGGRIHNSDANARLFVFGAWSRGFQPCHLGRGGRGRRG